MLKFFPSAILWVHDLRKRSAPCTVLIVFLSLAIRPCTLLEAVSCRTGTSSQSFFKLTASSNRLAMWK